MVRFYGKRDLSPNIGLGGERKEGARGPQGGGRGNDRRGGERGGDVAVTVVEAEIVAVVAKAVDLVVEETNRREEDNN